MGERVRFTEAVVAGDNVPHGSACQPGEKRGSTQNRFSGWGAWFGSVVGKLAGWAVLTTGLAGCVSTHLPPPEMRSEEWAVRQGQAVWRPRHGAPELAGDLILSTHPSGDFLVEFSKTPFTLVAAHRVGMRWEASFPTQDRRLGGHGTGSDRLLWLRLPDALAGKPVASPLTFSSTGPERWLIENHRTGERIEGFLSP